MELEFRYIKKDNDEIPEIFESILITYVYDNAIDISDIQYYTWLVKQYEVISQKGDIDSSDLQID